MGETGLSKLIEPVVQELGCELWGIEKLQQGRQVVLKIYIESADGINVDDCARVSRQVSAILDVEDPIPGEYMLEVSSPGVERRLFKPEHFNVCKGEKVQITLRQAFDGRRKFKGLLCGLEDEEVVIRVDDAQEIVLPMDSIERARVLM
ncbi:MAG TPA: ribosome maturation factor RimP [Gammaproteobacteria bacterium]|mgnify:FL=1|jgi:ribosome maturation factor RimP|nr:ribosome maturation factor RimP [Gammaproteobacteria bacterium]MDA7590005.1 ribosome maturation factor RimP [Pseudomonadales bacterium]MBT6791080.1 ribosome maturation factor RimP [Gammaproteobacteria bacterium]MBT7387641.1 ribosome maturation factor RimP [Gammaproteobacteria bacterium]MCH9786702.1 ribosome maturation factor RimP [Gammaproteobacteria bacterium]